LPQGEEGGPLSLAKVLSLTAPVSSRTTGKHCFACCDSLGLDNSPKLTIVRGVNNDRSERPPSVRQTEFLDDGTLVIVEYDPHGQVVRKSCYWSPDRELLERILAGRLESSG
jgi:hypothetical protein